MSRNDKLIGKACAHPHFNFQESGGMAKIAQVRQFTDYVRAQGWIDD